MPSGLFGKFFREDWPICPAKWEHRFERDKTHPVECPSLSPGYRLSRHYYYTNRLENMSSYLLFERIVITQYHTYSFILKYLEALLRPVWARSRQCCGLHLLMKSDAQSAAEPDVKRRGRQRSAEAFSAILSATCQLLEKKCLRDVTAEAIAQRSGVSKATIYKWWPNKNFVALDAFLMRMTRDVPTPDTGSAQKDFTEQLKSLVHFYVSPAGKLYCQFIAECQSNPAFLGVFRERFLQSRRNDVRVMWQRGIARGEIRSDVDGEIVLDLIYGPIIFRLLAGHGVLSDQQAEAIVEAVFRGIKA